MVQEGQAAGFAANGALSQAGEPDGVVIGSRVEAGHYAQTLFYPVFVDARDGAFPEGFRALKGGILKGVSFLEDTPGQQPAGHVILAPEFLQLAFRQAGDEFLRPLQVVCACALTPLGVRGDKIAKAKLPANVLRQLMGERLGAFHQETGPEAFRHRAHALLRALHEDGHLGEFPADHFAKVHTRIQLFQRRFVVPMQHKADIGNHTQEVLLILVIQRHGIVVVGSHQDFGTGTFAENLLVLVEGVAHGIHVLLEHQLVQQRQVGGVISDRIFYQQNALHAALEDVLRGVHAVFQQLDDGNDEVCAAVPVEDMVDVAEVPPLQLPVHLLGEGSE